MLWLPPTLAEEEFKNVWNAVESDLKAQGRSFADEGTTEEKAREEYRGIAERRVRLGLVLAEIGERNKIAVTDEEITRAIVERARQVPGREQEVWEFYQRIPARWHRSGRPFRGEGGRYFCSSSPRSARSRSPAKNSSRTTRTKRAPPASARLLRSPGAAYAVSGGPEDVRGLFCPCKVVDIGYGTVGKARRAGAAVAPASQTALLRSAGEPAIRSSGLWPVRPCISVTSASRHASRFWSRPGILRPRHPPTENRSTHA